MYRIAHLSDLHYTTARRPFIREILLSVKRSGAEHLVLTGDLTDNGSDVQMRGLLSLFKEFRFDTTDSITMIPGNHDLFGFIYQTFQAPGQVVGNVKGIRSLAKTAKTIWNFRRALKQYNTEEYLKTLQKFAGYYSFAFEGTIAVEGGLGGFPYIKRLPNRTALIGLDSNYLLPRVNNMARIAANARRAIRDHDVTILGDNVSGSTGNVDLITLERALSHPAIQGEKKIVLIHHCLDRLEELTARTTVPYALEMRLCNRDDVAAVLHKHYVDLVLHGHEHRQAEYLIEGGTRIVNGGCGNHGVFHRIDVTDHVIRVTASETRDDENRPSHSREAALS